MNALILDGSEPGLADLSPIRSLLVDLLTRSGWEAHSWILFPETIPPCCGNFSCWVKTPGLCAEGDICRRIGSSFINADLVIFLSRVVFGSYSYPLKKAVDHLIPNISPYFTKIDGETRHKQRYDSYPALMAVGWQPAPDEHARQVFEKLFYRNVLNFYPPRHASAVLFAGQAEDEQRELIARCLKEVGVSPTASPAEMGVEGVDR